MNYEEEQRNELEALSEIYHDEIEIISASDPISFTIHIRPQENCDYFDEENECLEDDDSDEEQDKFDNKCHKGTSIVLQFDLPSRYPDERPKISVIDSNDLEEYELLDLKEDLDKKADESLGMVMVFMLVNDVMEWLSAKSEKETGEQELEKERKQKEIEAEEIKRFDGTPVTVETFMVWKAKFETEMRKANLEDQNSTANTLNGNPKGGVRLSGRAMFESDKTLAESDLNFVEDLDQTQIEALLDEIDEVSSNEDNTDIEEEFSDTDSESDVDVKQ